MVVAFLNPQGNFDPNDSGWTEHPDFGGQLVYVKELSLALARQGHRVDILTRRIRDPDWPAFTGERDAYPGHGNLRILREPCGPAGFLPKEQLWPHLEEWVGNILALYKGEGTLPDIFTGHYADGGWAAARIQELRAVPFTFTGHSLGAQKMDKMISAEEAFAGVVEAFHFDRRIAAERLAMARAARIITSTQQERTEQYSHRLYAGAVVPRDEAKFAVVPPGVNLRIFDRDCGSKMEEEVCARVEAMLRRDIPAGRLGLAHVICSSRLDRKKNHLGLIRAWAASAQLRASANLLIVTRGIRNPLETWQSDFQGEEREIFAAIVGLIRDGDLADCVSAFDLNSQAELAAGYRHLGKNRRGIFALTSLYEPFGLAPLEAMAAGLPAVVTKNGGPSESLQDQAGQYGVLVDPEDPLDVARGVLELSAEEPRRRQLQRLAHERVLQRYTWERSADGYVREFKAILAGADSGDRSFTLPEDTDPAWLRNLYYGGSG